MNRNRTDEAPPRAPTPSAVACPYCLIMLDDGERARGGRTEVLDPRRCSRRSVVAEPLTALDPA